MPLKLWVRQQGGQPLQAHLSCVIDEVGTLGRAAGNDLVLDDPGRYISRRHARIERRGDAYYLVDTGSNPIVFNQRLLGHGCETLVQAGDELVIGDYQIAVQWQPEEAPGHRAEGHQDSQTLAVFAASMLPGPAEPLHIDPGSMMPGELAWEGVPILTTPVDALLNNDAHLPLPEPWAPLPMWGNVADVFIDNVPPRPPALVSDAEIPPHGYGALAGVLAAAPARASQDASGSRVACVPASSADNAVFQSLLDGLGLPQLLTTRSPEILARLVGELLREATGGVMEMLKSRALMKCEHHMEMTMLDAFENNPLKFFPDAVSLLNHVLSADATAYLAGEQAFRAAFDDLQAHETAMLMAMRASQAELLQRFEPTQIELRCAAPGLLARLRPVRRKARLWAALVELHSELVSGGDQGLQQRFAQQYADACQPCAQSHHDTH